MQKKSFREYLQTSFDTIHNEQPGAFELMMEALAGCKLQLAVDDENLRLVFQGEKPRITAIQKSSKSKFETEIKTGRKTILDLIDGKLDFLEAVMAGNIFFRGSSDTLLRLSKGLQLYLKGAIRCRSFPRLLEDFRTSV